jgi:hypothetical protein
MLAAGEGVGHLAVFFFPALLSFFSPQKRTHVLTKGWRRVCQIACCAAHGLCLWLCAKYACRRRRRPFWCVVKGRGGGGGGGSGR